MHIWHAWMWMVVVWMPGVEVRLRVHDTTTKKSLSKVLELPMCGTPANPFFESDANSFLGRGRGRLLAVMVWYVDAAMRTWERALC